MHTDENTLNFTEIHVERSMRSISDTSATVGMSRRSPPTRSMTSSTPHFLRRCGRGAVTRRRADSVQDSNIQYKMLKFFMSYRFDNPRANADNRFESLTKLIW
jgi:hypothetical protein